MGGGGEREAKICWLFSYNFKDEIDIWVNYSRANRVLAPYVFKRHKNRMKIVQIK